MCPAEAPLHPWSIKNFIGLLLKTVLMLTFGNPPTFQNFIFMGDFNAGCSYVPQKQWKNIRLRTNSEFLWLIGDKNDTTVKNSTRCPYDR